MKYKVVKQFRGSPDGCRVILFDKDEILVENRDFPMDLIRVAMVEGWVKPVSTPKKKAVKNADNG